MRNSTLHGVDPSGLIDTDLLVPIEDWCSRYQRVFGQRPPLVGMGCIGVVYDFVGKTTDLLKQGTECFSFKGNPSMAKAAADSAFANKKCKPCHYPAMFAYHFWTNGVGVPSCPKCGFVPDPVIRSMPSPLPKFPNFDFCVAAGGGVWLGANHGSTPDDPLNPTPHMLHIWPDFDTFANSYKKAFDTTVVCVTCTGDKYVQGSWPFTPTEGPCTKTQFDNLFDPPPLPPRPIILY